MVATFDAGGMDHVVKPIRPSEVLARITAHVQGARQARQARNAAGSRLSFTLHQPTGEDGWLLVMEESSDQAAMDALSLEVKLTVREGEVLYWVVKGKTNRDIGDILGSSAATVKKQLESVFAKIGVETRMAAAGLAMSRVGQLKVR